MRVYVPATLPLLGQAYEVGEFGPAPVTAFAVTPTVREWYLDEDIEELEYAVFAEAARASLRLLDADPTAPRRRVVLSVDVADDVVKPRPELDRAVVRVSTVLARASWACAHVDGTDAEKAVAAASASVMAADLGDDDARFVMDGAEEFELEWYDLSELDGLLGKS